MQARMKSNALRRKRHDDELRALQAAVDAFDLATRVKTFEQLPLSERTQKGGSCLLQPQFPANTSPRLASPRQA